MIEVLLFHHALGLTDGVRAFADGLRRAGHAVVAPDLYDGKVFASLDDGVAYAEDVGFETVIARGVRCADGMGDDLVVVGFSLGAMPAQKLAQTRAGTVGAVLVHSAVPSATFGNGWPAGAALQLHLSEGDPWAEEDLPAARSLAKESGGELFVYPGSRHLVAEPGFRDYDPEVAALILERTLGFLEVLSKESRPVAE